MPALSGPPAVPGRGTPPACPSHRRLWTKADTLSQCANNRLMRFPSFRFFQKYRPASTALRRTCCKEDIAWSPTTVCRQRLACRLSRNSNSQCGSRLLPALPVHRASVAAPLALADLSDISPEKSEILLPPIWHLFGLDQDWQALCNASSSL